MSKHKNEEEKTDDKMMNSKHHTMFIEEVPEMKEMFGDVKHVYKITPAHKEYRVFIDSFAEMERGLHEMFNELWNANDDDTLELRINSWGGIVKEGQNFFNIINNKFKGRTTTILDSAGYSMGALTFLMGNERIVTEEADLMLHDYSGGLWGKGGEMEAQLEHNKKHLRKFFSKVLVDSGFLSKKEFKKMIIGKDYWMDTKELCERGMATHVLINGQKIPAKKYLKSLKK